MFNFKLPEKLSHKQQEFWDSPNRRYMLKIGAARVGKTWLDMYKIGKTLIEMADKDGLNVILANTKGTLSRNLIEPMQNLYSKAFVSDINSNNVATILGQKVHCLGADNVRQVNRLRGSSIKFCYADEITTYPEEIFQMLKSRLDKSYSVLIATGNPSFPSHWLKKFIDDRKDDIFHQHYTLYDNPFLPPDVVEEFEKMYPVGSVHHTRLIRGEWSQASGGIYSLYAQNPARYAIPLDEHGNEIMPVLDIGRNRKRNGFEQINVGVDFGGEKSKHALCATGITHGYKELYALMSECHEASGTTPSKVDEIVVNFARRVLNTYGRVDFIEWDNESSVLGRGIRDAIERELPQVGGVHPCLKPKIINRIDLTCRLMGLDRFKISRLCPDLHKSLQEAVWDEKNEDIRLDNFSYNVDILDAFEYSFSRHINKFI